ncbi:MAG TPA: DUF5690 family protein [Verrucomicrobiae bacterium]|nr:DUF5690 family protein [Verrucomicrobiae bacterium]
MPSFLSRWLAKAPAPVFILYAVVVAFSTYFCMYAFRKPFAAATFHGQSFFGSGVQLKTALVISQIIGYALSKFIGIKVCSEAGGAKRARLLVWLIACAEGALILFAIVPPNWRIIPIFFNGLPLGMVWGLVVSYLEGRRTSELLLAGLSCSFIVSSGIVKDFARALMEGTVAKWWNAVPVIGPTIASWGSSVSEAWMPAVTGFYFLVPFLISVWLLNQIPRPDAQDVKERVARKPMDRRERLAFVREFSFGIILLCSAYFFLTGYRDFRDNYQVELFDGLGYAYKQNQMIISRTETLVAFGVLGALALLSLFRENKSGLLAAFGVMSGGAALMGISTLLLDAKMISGFWWMTLIGLGSYLAYVPYGSLLFDRLIASTGIVGTAVFAIYVADAVGYTGSVGLQLFKDLAESGTSRLVFFKHYTYFMSILGTICLVSSCVYFLRRQRRVTKIQTPVQSEIINA